MSASARYRQEITAEYRALEREQRAMSPRAWALSELLLKLLDDMDPLAPAFPDFASLQLQMLSVLDQRQDVSEHCELMILAAIDFARASDPARPHLRRE